jgi:hypothetical protein
VTHPVMEWLAAGLPLSLLVDLSEIDSLNSSAIMEAESDSCDWISAQCLDVAALDGLARA